MNLNSVDLAIASVACFLIGFSKSGIKGISMLFIALIAMVFGAKASTGIIVPFLMIGDILAVTYFKRFANWKYFFKLLPWMVVGVLFGVYFGNDLPEAYFKKWFIGIILLSVVMMLWWEKSRESQIPRKNWFAIIMGLCAGFTTMIGNLAGAFSNIYFLSIRLPKKEFIGTTAWLFFVINIFKFPFHYFSWKTITPDTLKINLIFAPLVILGFIIGLKVVNRINELLYRRIIIVFTIIAVIFIILK